jgi:hypothetical protein
MFNTWKSLAGFAVGLALTIGLLLSPHLVPGGFGFRAGLAWPAWQVAGVFTAGLAVLALALWIAGRLVRGAKTWKSLRVILAALLIAALANTLYMFLVELFALGAGWRALVATLGVPVIYGNLAAELGGIRLRQAMLDILTGALTTMGAAFILVGLIKGW